MIVLGGLVMGSGLLLGCPSPSAPPQAQVLLQVGDLTVSPEAFRQRLALSSELDPDPRALSALIPTDPDHLLQELVEELLIRHYARDHRIDVTADELDQAIHDFRGGLSADEFETLIIETAQTPEMFRRRLYLRLLTAKAIRQGVLASVALSADDVQRHVATRTGQTNDHMVDAKDAPLPPEDLLAELRQIKGRQIYGEWLQTLRQRYPVTLDRELWHALREADSTGG